MKTQQYKVQPFKDNVIVKHKPRPQEMYSNVAGLLLPSNIQNSDFDYLYDVLAIGPKVRDVKVGDTVYIHPDARMRPATVDDEKIWRVEEESIMYIRKSE